LGKITVNGTRFSVQSVNAANLILFTLNRKFFRAATDTFSSYQELDMYTSMYIVVM